MTCRFFAGTIGSAALVVSPAILCDCYRKNHRGVAISIFVTVILAGPNLGPPIGALIVKNESLAWRWSWCFCGLIGVLCLTLVVFTMEETNHAIILTRKADILRRRTDNWGFFAPHDEIELSIKEILENNSLQPLKMICTEPILLLVSIYNAFVYAILYMILTVFLSFIIIATSVKMELPSWHTWQC